MEGTGKEVAEIRKKKKETIGNRCKGDKTQSPETRKKIVEVRRKEGRKLEDILLASGGCQWLGVCIFSLSLLSIVVFWRAGVCQIYIELPEKRDNAQPRTSKRLMDSPASILTWDIRGFCGSSSRKGSSFGSIFWRALAFACSPFSLWRTKFFIGSQHPHRYFFKRGMGWRCLGNGTILLLGYEGAGAVD